MTQPDPARQAHGARPQVPKAAPRFASTPRTSGQAPGPAASLRRRIDGRVTQARTTDRRRLLLLGGGAVLVTAGPAAVMALNSGTWAAVTLILVGLAVGAFKARALVGLDGPTRELRRRASAEVRTARALEPLESAGWAFLHDRLVGHERVPHLLVGPPGVLVTYPYSFGRLAPLGRLARRVRHPRRARVPWTVDPDLLDTATALRARTNLLTALSAEPDLAEWDLIAYALTPVLHLPRDRALPTCTGVVHQQLGSRFRRELETALPAGLNRTAVAYLASIADHAFPSA